MSNTQQGHTIIVQKALGQDNIDELLKVSEDYKKGKCSYPSRSTYLTMSVS